ncbi:MAG TPA: alpha/beta hydrolase [Solirubrobacteraceae bacterium]|jgi:pimeloyl-ACP methyl ester carboxylesterase
MSGGVVTAGDGRTLAYEELGDAHGTPVFLLHGTPGSRFSGRHPEPERVVEAGLRVLTYDRPGYGQSTRHRGRSVVDCVADVAAIADQLGIDRFAVKGGSGGGPHALAVGARLSARVTHVGCDVGVAPFDADDIDWFAGMDPSNVKEFKWALAGEETLAPELERESEKALARVAEDPSKVLGEFDLSSSDLAVLSNPVVQNSLRKSTREAFANGAWGWVDDDLAFAKPWGFDVSELTVPVVIRYGATDVLVPAAHGEWLTAHIPHAEVAVDTDGGHLSLPDKQLERLRELVSA